MPLANAAIDAIELWIQHVPAHEAAAAYPEILPIVDLYLTSPILDKLDSLGRKETVPKRNKSRIFSGKGSFSEEEKNSGDFVRKRMVHLLGSIGGVGSSSLVNSCMRPASDETPPWISWSNSPLLEYSLPMKDMKIDILFDDVLPRVVELSKDSSNRVTKVQY